MQQLPVARSVAAVAGLATVILLGACTSAPGAVVSASPMPAFLDFAGAPAAVRNRPRLPACGFEVGHAPEGFNLEARTCFWTAVSTGQPAEFISTRPAANGTPIVVIWRSLGGGRVEYFVDRTRSTGPDRAWHRTTCPRLTLTNDPTVAPDWIPGVFGGGCTDEVLPAGS